MRLEWTQDAGRAQWTDKLTYNQLTIERDRPHEGKIQGQCTHRDKGGKGRFELWTPLGHRDAQMAVCLPLPRFP